MPHRNPNIERVYADLSVLHERATAADDAFMDGDLTLGDLKNEWTEVEHRLETILLDAQSDLRASVLDAGGEDGEWQHAVNEAYHAWHMVKARFSDWNFG